MASLYKNKKRKVWIIDVYRIGKIRAGTNKQVATEICQKVEALVEAKKLGVPPDSSTALWVKKLSPGYLLDRLSALELVDPLDVPKTLGELLDAFWQRTPENHNSREFYKQVVDSLRRYFGADKPVQDVTESDAFAFRTWLKDSGRLIPHETKGTRLGGPTVSRRIVGARQVFKLAIRLGWAPVQRVGAYDCPVNPFAEVKTGKQFSPEKVYFVSYEESEAVIKALPSAEFKLAFGLVRYAGLRCPSELRLLLWSDIDLRAREMSFRAPKTSNYAGKEIRTCPIFREVATGIDLLSLFEAMGPNSGGFVLPTIAAWNNPGQAFTKVVKQAIKDAGLEPWPKLFVNCRGTRATEVSRLYGPVNESAWLGHSEDTARLHYLRQMPSDWKLATGIEKPDQGQPASHPQP